MRKNELKKWEERLEKMNNYEKVYLITGIEDGWIDPSIDDWHIYCKLKDIDEYPILTWLKKIVKGLVKAEVEPESKEE